MKRQKACSFCSLPMNKQIDIASQMMAYYREIASRRGGGGWRSVGEKIGYSGAYARQIAMGAKPVTPDIAGDWLTNVDWKPEPGIASPKRAPRRFYRPCLSVELGEAIREDRIDLESLLWTVIVAGRQERKKRAA